MPEVDRRGQVRERADGDWTLNDVARVTGSANLRSEALRRKRASARPSGPLVADAGHTNEGENPLPTSCFGIDTACPAYTRS